MTMTPLGRLIRTRMGELSIRSGRLAARLGYRNIAKGVRRIDAVCRGDLAGKEQLLAKLPGALALPADVVATALEETRNELERARQAAREREEAEWRAKFRPHAIITTERNIPSPIFIAVMIGPEQLKRVDVDAALPVERIHQQVQEEIQRRLAQWHGEILTFGKATGYVLNWAPERAERYDLAGLLIEVLPKAHRLGEGTLSVKGKDLGPVLRTLTEPQDRIKAGRRGER